MKIMCIIALFCAINCITAADQKGFRPLSVSIPLESSPTLEPLNPSPPESHSSSDHRMSISSGSSNGSHNHSTTPTSPSSSFSSKPASATAAAQAIFSPSQIEALLRQQQEKHEAELQKLEERLKKLEAQLEKKRSASSKIRPSLRAPNEHSRQSSIFSLSSASNSPSDPGTPFFSLESDKQHSPPGKDSPPPSPPERNTSPARTSPALGKKSPTTSTTLAPIQEQESLEIWIV